MIDTMLTTSKEFTVLERRKRLNDTRNCYGVIYAIILCMHVAGDATTIATVEVCASITSWEQPILALCKLYVFSESYNSQFTAIADEERVIVQNTALESNSVLNQSFYFRFCHQAPFRRLCNLSNRYD